MFMEQEGVPRHQTIPLQESCQSTFSPDVNLIDTTRIRSACPSARSRCSFACHIENVLRFFACLHAAFASSYLSVSTHLQILRFHALLHHVTSVLMRTKRMSGMGRVLMRPIFRAVPS